MYDLPYILFDDGRTAVMRANVARQYVSEVTEDAVLIRFKRNGKDIQAHAELEFKINGKLRLTSYNNLTKLMSVLDECLYPEVEVIFWADTEGSISYLADQGFLCA